MYKQFLVVFEDVWNNKEYEQTTRIGDTIKRFVEANDLKREEEVDYARYNSDNPYDIGTMGYGFYDIVFQDDEEEYAGRIMIFGIE